MTPRPNIETAGTRRYRRSACYETQRRQREAFQTLHILIPRRLETLHLLATGNHAVGLVRRGDS